MLEDTPYPITAVMAGLTPCETYHIKFCIADAGDGSLSSYVFFEESSFSSGGDVAMNNVSNIGSTNDIYEGCENFYVFNRIDTSAVAMQDTLDIILNIGGTATEGVDYTDIPDTLYILPGHVNDTLYYTAIFDNIDEGDEYIIFSLLNGCPCTQTSTDDTIWIRNNYHLNATINDPALLCYGDSSLMQVEINPNIDPLLVSYLWDTGDTISGFMAQPTSTTTYQVTVTNVCESDAVLNSSIQVVPTINPNFVLSKDTACVGEPVVATFNGSATSLAQYNWTFTDGTPNSISGQGPQNINWASTGLKDISLNIDDQGCLNDTTLQIYIREYSNMSLTTTTSNINCFNVCDGSGTVNANSGVAPYTYLWEDGQTNLTANNLCPGTFDVTVSDAYGCKDTTHITVTSPSELTYTYSTTPVSCYGFEDGNATVNVSGGTPPYSYIWSDSNLVETNINLSANTYTVTITDANGCTEIENNISISQHLPIITSLYGEDYNNNEIWICKGETEILHSSATGGIGPYTFEWNMGTVSDQLSVNPQNTSQYWAIATDNNGCVSSQKNITVNVYQAITINSTALPSKICLGELVNVDINVSGGNGNYNYELESPSGTIEVSNQFTIAPEQTQDYIISVSDNCNSPIDKDTFNILVYDPPVISFHADKNNGCPPIEIGFNETSEENNQSYTWEFINSNGESDISFDKNPSHIFKQTGTYNIKLSVTNEHNCKSELIKYNYLTIFPIPRAAFTSNPSVKSIIKPQIFFQNQSIGADLYQWNFGDSDSSSQVSPEHLFPYSVSNYNTKLIALNRYGCSDTISQKIRIVDEITFYTPTAFSPDGDGKNEVFSAKGNGMTNNNFEMIIYDRWGMEIFKTNNLNSAWNGKSSNGNYVNPGIYSWVIKFTDVYQVPHEKSGQVNLIR